jgi:hypothetical protein
LGFSTDILGSVHVPLGNAIEFGFCPPTSGNHYNNPPRGPIPANFYPPNQEPAPGGWVHNLEHGYVALLYRCPGGAAGADGCPTQQQLDQLRQWFQTAPAPPSGCPKKVLVVRFDEMTTQFAMVSWGRALMTDTFDPAVANTFAQQWMEHESLSERAVCT